MCQGLWHLKSWIGKRLIYHKLKCQGQTTNVPWLPSVSRQWQDHFSICIASPKVAKASKAAIIVSLTWWRVFMKNFANWSTTLRTYGSSYNDRCLPALESPQRLLALLLGAVAVNGGHRETLAIQELVLWSMTFNFFTPSRCNKLELFVLENISEGFKYKSDPTWLLQANCRPSRKYLKRTNTPAYLPQRRYHRHLRKIDWTLAHTTCPSCRK